MQASVFGDGGTPETAAFGILGGRSGSANEIELRYPDGTVQRPRLKDLVTDIPAGTVYRQVAGGGGGYGDPHRDAKRVADEPATATSRSRTHARSTASRSTRRRGRSTRHATGRLRDASS